MRILLKVVNGLITALLVLVIVAAGGMAYSARRSGDAIPTILGRKVLTVLSGSMEPKIHTGDVIIVQPLAHPESEVHEGDVITYRTQEQADMLITHRVIGTIWTNDKVYAYVTKGDANATQDMNPVAPMQVMGRYSWRIPYFGYLISLVHKPIGIVLFVILPGVIIIGLEFRKMWQAISEEEKAKAEAAATDEGRDQAQ